MAETTYKIEMPYAELLIGCGADRSKRMSVNNSDGWTNLITLDMNERVNPDVVHDLDDLPYPFLTNELDEIHAYEVLEHCGRQGDWRGFFEQFDEFHRILKPGGILYATVPSWTSVHAWGDPGHTRIINEGTIVFLQRDLYGGTGSPMTDYRTYYKGNFEVVGAEHRGEHFMFCLRAIK